MEHQKDEWLMGLGKGQVLNGDQPMRSENEFDPSIPKFLPHERMYSIQVGDKLFTMSGASLSSDGPSYFTNFFQKNENEGKFLFIDRSPVVFQKIQMHLQGYHIKIEEASEYIHLFEDANYFSLFRLIKIICDMNYYVLIGSRSFVMERGLLNAEGNHPNYFSLAYDTLLHNPGKIIHFKNLIRPPPQAPLTVSNRSPHLFAMLLRFLQGESTDAVDDSLRQDLINECKYYRFLALQQKLIKHHIRTNPVRSCEEIVIEEKYVSPKGLVDNSCESSAGYLMYQRPYVDKCPRELVIQLSGAEASLDVSQNGQSFDLSLGPSLAKRLNKLFGKFTSEPLIYEETQGFSEPLKDCAKLIMLARINEDDVCVKIDGLERDKGWMCDALNAQNSNYMSTIYLTKSLWKIVIHNKRVWMEAVKFEGVSSVHGWNKSTSFV